MSLSQATLDIFKVAALLLQGLLQGEVFATQFIPLLLSFIERLASLSQLLVFMCLLGGKLLGLGRLRRLMAPGMVHSSTHRTRFILPEVLAQLRHTFATHGAAVFNEITQMTIGGFTLLQMLPGALAVFDQVVPALLGSGQLLSEFMAGLLDALQFLPGAGQLTKGQAMLSGLVDLLLGSLTSVIEGDMLADQLFQGCLQVVALCIELSMALLGLAALIIKLPDLALAFLNLPVKLGQLMVQRCQCLGIFTRLA